MPTNKSQNQAEKAQLMKSALPIGTVLQSPNHKYKIVEVLGAGGFGITYKVSSLIKVGNVTTKMYFVIKEHFLKGCDRGKDGKTVTCSTNMRNEYEDSRSDFITEAIRLNKLGSVSPNIVKVNEHFTANNTAYYVMEYLDGRDLDKLVTQQGPLSEAKALSIIIPIAKAVEYLHQDRLLHLDIKPDNIVLKTDASTGAVTPVLIDFGLAKHFDSKGHPTSSLAAKGATDGYAPIEQYTEITTFATEIDIYALGATLYFLLTGNDPPKAFYIRSSEEFLKSLPSVISARTHAALVGAMQPSPLARTKDAKTFLTSLEESSTLPIGSVIHGKNNYQVIGVIGQTHNYIHYRTILTSTSKGHVGETPVLRKYDVYEWFEQDRDKRIDNINVAPKSYRELSDDSVISTHWFSTVKNLLPKELRENSSQKDSSGHLLAELFRSNGTWYQSCIVRKKPSLWITLGDAVKRSLASVLNFASNNKGKIAAVIGVLAIVGLAYEGILWYSNRPRPTKDEILKTAIEEKDTALLLSLVNDSSYSAAIAPLASIYLESGDTINALKYAKRAPQDSTCDNIVKAIEEARKSTALNPDNGSLGKSDNSKQQENTLDELYNKANTISDYLSLAQKGYTKAYYPLANKYYNAGNKTEAKKWASKAISAGVNVNAANNLLSKINEKGIDEALRTSDWNALKKLADKGESRAYIPLAKHYLKSDNYSLADSYAQKAYNAGVQVATAKSVLEVLKGYGYYDDKVLPSALR